MEEEGKIKLIWMTFNPFLKIYLEEDLILDKVKRIEKDLKWINHKIYQLNMI